MFEDLKVPTLAVVENMSHFTCEHGARYYPFGRGGRDKLLRGLGAAGGEGLSQAQQDTQWRLQRCPMQSIPLVIEPEDRVTENNNDDVNRGSSSGGKGAGSSCGDAHCTHDRHSHSSSGSSSSVAAPQLPIVLREPVGESSEAFRRLADDVINEVYRSQAEAVMVREAEYRDGLI